MEATPGWSCWECSGGRGSVSPGRTSGRLSAWWYGCQNAMHHEAAFGVIAVVSRGQGAVKELSVDAVRNNATAQEARGEKCR